MNIQEEWHLTETEDAEQQNYHKPIEEEYSLYQAIRSGDLDYVKQDCANGGFGNPEGMGVLSDSVGMSRAYLSRLFHQEVGVSLTDYIRMQKIEKAQNLLRYSDYDYIEIANYLGFSSQSHFIEQFRKCTGLTPKKYRDRYYHTMW